MDVQESESAIITSFTPYYPGCVPVQIVNHFPDIAIKFKQDTKYDCCVHYMLSLFEVEGLYRSTIEHSFVCVFVVVVVQGVADTYSGTRRDNVLHVGTPQRTPCPSLGAGWVPHQGSQTHLPRQS